jgi:hypothetical protein
VADNVDQFGNTIWRIEGKTLRQFLLSTAPVQIVLGPIGSGKSVALFLKMWKVANEQRPAPDGIRRTRWAVARNNYPALRTTTIRTFLDVFPERSFGSLKWSQPPTMTVRYADVAMEVDFLALDKSEDVAKLRSAEYTGIAFNELSFLDVRELFDEATSRVGRFPPMRDGGAYPWSGVIADTNCPSQDHWLALMRGMVPAPEGLLQDERLELEWPQSWDFFQQPPGLLEVRDNSGALVGYDDNPEAENVANLPPGYYGNLIAGKSRAWIKSRILNQVALVVDGEAVWKSFRRDLHVAREVLRPVRGRQLWLAMDFGRSPAVLIAQNINDRISIIEEVIGFNTSATLFAPAVKRRLEQTYAGFDFVAFGDPKGGDRSQCDERSAMDIWAASGIHVKPAPVRQHNLEIRLSAVDSVLTSLSDRRPRLQVSPSCRTLIAALEGAYHYARRRQASEIKTEPEKDKYSHVADALQYLCVSMGEGRVVAGLTPLNEAKPIQIYRGHRSMRRVA